VTDDLIAAGLVIGVAIAVVLLAISLMDRSRMVAWLAGLLVIAVAAIAIIVDSWTADPSARRWLQFGELALMAASGPVVVIVAAELLRAARTARWLVAISAGGFVAALLVTLRFGGDPMFYAVPLQSGFVLYGWMMVARSTRANDRRHRAYRQRLIAIGLIVAFTVSNGASVLRLLFSDVASLRSVVPLTMSLVLIALMLVLLWLLLRRSSSLLADASGRPTQNSILAEKAAALIVRESLFRKPGLRIETVAERLGVPPARLAAGVAGSHWGGFAAMLQDLRIEEVRRMLSSREERATSIDAIGLLCGFRSRSALYEAFQRKFGVSPGQYRRESCPDS
jgi:AraC-like DNA-binding protein